MLLLRLELTLSAVGRIQGRPLNGGLAGAGLLNKRGARLASKASIFMIQKSPTV